MLRWICGIIIICLAFVISSQYIFPEKSKAPEISRYSAAASNEIANLDSLAHQKEVEEKEDTAELDVSADTSLAERRSNPVEGDTALSEEKLWPVKSPELLRGSLLPAHRIVAFYGNLYSRRMGILGEYGPAEVLSRLQQKVDEWQAADSSVKVIPALELIAVTGQGVPTRDSLYRQRMPEWMLDSVLNMAKKIEAIVILDIQVGHSTVEKEVPYFEKYLKMPNVHLAVDPEFSMKRGSVPGKRIGTMDAADINFCVNYLKGLVEENNIPPKLLIVHRFTQGMVTNYQKIKLASQVQIIMNMDGFGAQALKKDAYRSFIYKEPVEYAGIKLFFKNDNAGNHRIMNPKEVLELHPKPVYVQYQ